MSGIAEVLLNLGYSISGSDIQDTAVTRRLAGLGARIAIGHGADNIKGAGAIVTSTAVSADNPERSEEHTSELQSLMRISYAVFCLKKKKLINQKIQSHQANK